MVQIVVLDGYTLSPGDLSWDSLAALGQCARYDRTPPDQIVQRARDAHIVVTNKVLLSAEVLAQLPKLKFIAVTATGYNCVDIPAATARGIPVSNVPTYGTVAVAQMVFAHLLHLALHVADHAAGTRQGRWSASPDFCYWDYPQVELEGLTLGVVGFGRIGRAVARLGLAFGMKVLAADSFSIPATEGVTEAALDEVFHTADVVSLHCPLTPDTKELVDRRRLALMKPTAYLINTSRGPLVDEQALADALNEGRIAGAALDVLCVEPPPADHPLLAAKNCYVTPHCAWATRSARQRLLNATVENIRAFLAGAPQNVVNP